MKKHTKLTLTIIAALSGLVLATACRGNHGKHKDPEKAYKFLTWHIDDILDDLKATDKQSQEVHELKDELFQEGLAFKSTSKELREALIKEWMQDAPDGDKMHAQVDLWVDEVRRLGHLMVDASLKLHDILNKEQRFDLARIIAEHAED